MVPTTPRASDRICSSCARPAVGFGVIAQYKKDIHWCCGEPDCFVVALRTYKMQPREFDRIDSMATVKGGEEAGAYLDEIGKSDLAELEPAQWDEFCRRLVGGYRHALHVTLRDESPF